MMQGNALALPAAPPAGMARLRRLGVDLSALTACAHSLLPAMAGLEELHLAHSRRRFDPGPQQWEQRPDWEAAAQELPALLGCLAGAPRLAKFSFDPDAADLLRRDSRASPAYRDFQRARPRVACREAGPGPMLPGMEPPGRWDEV